MSDIYKALVGLSYPPGQRAEPGDYCPDEKTGRKPIPERSIRWLREQGLIEKVKTNRKDADR